MRKIFSSLYFCSADFYRLVFLITIPVVFLSDYFEIRGYSPLIIFFPFFFGAARFDVKYIRIIFSVVAALFFIDAVFFYYTAQGSLGVLGVFYGFVGVSSILCGVFHYSGCSVFSNRSCRIVLFLSVLLAPLHGKVYPWVEQKHVFLMEIFFVLWFLCVYGVCFEWLKRWLLYAVCFFVFLIFLNLYSFFYVGTISSNERALYFSFHILFSIFLCAFFVKSWKNALYPALATVCSVFVVFCCYFIYWFYLDDPFSFDWTYDSPFHMNIRHLGYFLMVSCIASVGLFCLSRSKYSLFYLTAVFLSFSLLFWSGGRASIISVLLGTAFCFVAFWLAGLKKKLFWVFVAVMAGFLGALLFRTGQAWMGAMYIIDGGGVQHDLNSFSSGRLSLWAELMPFAMQRAFTGWGGEAVRYLYRGPFVQAHNGFLQVFLEWGVFVSLGFIGYIIFWFASGLLAMVRGWATLGYRFAPFLAVVVGFLFYSLFDGVFYYGVPLMFLSLSISFLMLSRFGSFSD